MELPSAPPNAILILFNLKLVDKGGSTNVTNSYFYRNSGLPEGGVYIDSPCHITGRHFDSNSAKYFEGGSLTLLSPTDGYIEDSRLTRNYAKSGESVFIYKCTQANTGNITLEYNAAYKGGVVVLLQ